ncbi:small ribosomal subunit protein eS27-like [Vulpes vulpes]|uniref:Small ribosomal subunit protein eS27-like n=1 Tax=Vulpes vulpes TaxID=9627 RepID=A0A3Q7RN30_VULVU|nr:40S ribosomal protein S27-like [Vulpes vulpes]
MGSLSFTEFPPPPTPPEKEKRKHKKKHLVQNTNSYFMDVKFSQCYKITTLSSHAQRVVLCVGCSTILCQPTEGNARLREGCSFTQKQHPMPPVPR